MSKHAILIVEDDEILRTVLHDYFTAAGFLVFEASNSDDARNTITECKTVELIVTDVNIPGPIDGAALARWVAEALPHLPVILVSGDAKNAIEDSHNRRFVRKPYELDNLEQTIRHMLH